MARLEMPRVLRIQGFRGFQGFGDSAIKGNHSGLSKV